MQTLIIGGTRGLGAELAKSFNVLGDVIATGKELDISSLESRFKLFKMMESADIIINNAYCGIYQRDILIGAFERFRNTEKIFVNIESVNAWREGKLTIPQIEYATNKLALVTARRDLQKLDRNMTIIGVCPSTIDTEFNAAKQIPKIPVTCAADIIVDIVIICQLGTEISEIHFQRFNKIKATTAA